MKSIYKVLTLLSVVLGILGISISTAKAQTVKTMQVNYVSTTGQQVRAPLTYHRSANGVSAFGSGLAYSATGYASSKGYVKKKLRDTCHTSCSKITLTISCRTRLP
ncbi:hypothetical protein [Lentilactobacillus kisonensis]|uniref:hypothetical protein n=1 Tax=Lentilactobacillus kisonensis TaxID=481722 RepID=UPI001FB41EA0|nr:hypothetical protein [Lentilactobacillus kisonensis]